MNPNTVALTTFTGSVVVTSPIPLAVSADQFEGNAPFEFIYPSQLSTNLLIPFLPADTGSVDVNVFNPGPNQAEVKLVLVQSDGTHTETRTATVDPLHTSTISVAASANVSYAYVTTANILRPVSPVAASAVIRSFNAGTAGAPGAVQRSDFAVVPAIPNRGFTKTTQIPFFAQGPDYFTLVQIDNLSSTQQTISVAARQADGSSLSSLCSSGSTRESLKRKTQETTMRRCFVFSVSIVPYFPCGRVTNRPPSVTIESDSSPLYRTVRGIQPTSAC